jgi:hypothetical protein
MTSSITTPVPAFARSWNALLDRIPPLPSLIRESNAVDLLGGTFKSFTDRAENIDALRSVLDRDAPVRILIMHPDSQANALRAQDRKARGVTTSVERLAHEVLVSLMRFVDHLGVDTTMQSVRLYDSLPHNAVYRLGTFYLVNLYTFGRGGSSPALGFPRNEETADLCAALDASFNDQWAASSTHALQSDILDRASRA